MHYLEWTFRNAKQYVLTVECLLTVFAAVVLYQVVSHASQLWTVMGRIGASIPGPWRSEKSPSLGDNLRIRTKASWELQKDNVAVFAIQGRRPHMEDRFNVVTDLEHTDASIYGVFDGHGGEFAADFVEKTLFKTIMVRLLKSALSGEREGLSALLTEEVLNVDKQLLQIEKLTHDVSGTTALIALLRENLLTVANVGDSRGVLCDKDGKAVAVSYDHKPQQLKERKRIKKAGGFISFNGVWRVAGVLATSRALGDFPLKERGLVIAEPDVLTFDLAELQPRFMILASDGLWDTFSNEEAVGFINERLEEPHYGAKSLVLQAYYRGSLDNITVMVVNFMANSQHRDEDKEAS